MKILLRYKIVIVLLISLTLVTNNFQATEVTANETKSQVSEIDQFAKNVDPAPDEQNYIMLSDNQTMTIKGNKVEYIKSSVDYSQINSTMYGEWGVYKINGHYVFCIEPGSDTLSSAINDTTNHSLYGKFSNTTQTYLDQVSASSVSHYEQTDNNDYIFAGQLLIWEYLSDHERAVIGNPMESWNPLFLDSWTIRKSAKYKAEIATIEEDVANFTVLPSFLKGSVDNPAKYTLTYNYSKNNYGITLTDTNHVWDDKFADYTDYGQIKVTNPSGADNVRFETATEHTGYFSPQSYKWSLSLSNHLELYDSGQDLTYIGPSPVYGYIQFKTEKNPLGGYKIKKVDKATNQPLAGVEFKLVNSSGKTVDTFKTNNNGQYTSEKKFKAGNYKLIETATIPGYILDSTPHPVTISPSLVTDLSSKPYQNQMIKGGFKLTKTGEQLDGQMVPLAGTEFEVTSSTYPDFKQVYTTDSDGQIITANTELNYGQYHISEIATDSNYVLGFEQDFSITKNHQIVELNNSEPIINQEYGGRIEIEKQGVNEITEASYPLAGAQFDIYKEGAEPNQIIDEEDQLVEQITSNAEGIASSELLPVGSYVVVESVSPPGYVLDSQQVPFEIVNDQLTDQIISIGTMTNDLITGQVELKKEGVGKCTSEDCAVPLAGVEFAIYQDLNSNQQIDQQEETPIEVLKTDDKGYAISNSLEYGDYILQETAVNHLNYQKSKELYPFKIEAKDAVVQVNNGDPIINLEKQGQITLTKSGPTLENFSSNIVNLEGAEYTVFDNQNNIVTTLITNEDGYAESIPLSYGDYQLIETQAPVGYQLDDSVYQFSIDDQSYKTPIEVHMADQLITNDVKITKVDIDNNQELPGAKMEINDRETKTKVETWTSTTEAHEVTLNYGKYQICEETAPNGYRLNKQCTDFEVTENGVTQEFTFENEPMKMAVTGAYRVDQIIKLVIILIIGLCIKYIINLKYERKITC